MAAITGSDYEITHYISSMQDSNVITKARPTFSGSSNTAGMVWTHSDIGVSGESMIAIIIGSTFEHTQWLSFHKTLQRNCYDCSTLNVYRPTNWTVLMWIIWMWDTYVRPVMATIFELPLTPRSESVHTSSALLADLENVRVAFGIPWPSCIEAEILRYFIVTSGNDGHL